MVRRMMNATDVVLITALAEAVTMGTSVVRANMVGEIVKEAMVSKRDGTTVAGLARQGAMARATLEKAAEAIMDVDPKARVTAAVALAAGIPEVAWEQGVVTTRICREVGWEEAAPATILNTDMALVGVIMALVPGAAP
jgi:hypothetical protein